MKTESWLLAMAMAIAIATAFLLTGCIQPEMVRESALPESTVRIRSLVIAVDDSMISPPLFGRFGKAYVNAMEASLKSRPCKIQFA
jgi:hypothetical protein